MLQVSHDQSCYVSTQCATYACLTREVEAAGAVVREEGFHTHPLRLSIRFWQVERAEAPSWPEQVEEQVLR